VFALCGSGSGIPDHISQSLESIFWSKNTLIHLDLRLPTGEGGLPQGLAPCPSLLFSHPMMTSIIKFFKSVFADPGSGTFSMFDLGMEKIQI
jgi:hypothetical protein